jgi:hypothetical protein
MVVPSAETGPAAAQGNLAATGALGSAEASVAAPSDH